uniref:Uncharacterized protein n=1 Tax=Ixodes ricinus TaxID=34613 RepID=A0A0K8RIQ9_IXORI
MLLSSFWKKTAPLERVAILFQFCKDSRQYMPALHARKQKTLCSGVAVEHRTDCVLWSTMLHKGYHVQTRQTHVAPSNDVSKRFLRKIYKNTPNPYSSLTTPKGQLRHNVKTPQQSRGKALGQGSVFEAYFP